eukprot:COSAG02_NODE_6547_length_3502_cov_58.042766_2_plen_514_part_00
MCRVFKTRAIHWFWTPEILDIAVTVLPCFAGLLVTIIATFQFARHSQALQWAADKLESELWRYRARTGPYCGRVTSWTELMDQVKKNDCDTPSVAHRQQRILKAFVLKQKDIVQHEEVQYSHNEATCAECAYPLSGLALSECLHGCGRADRLVEPTRKQIDDIRMRLFKSSVEKDREQSCCGELCSVLSGEKPVLGFLWELYFEFLLYNEQGRFRSSGFVTPMVQNSQRPAPVGELPDDGREYFQSLPLRLIVVCFCTIVLPLRLVLYPIKCCKAIANGACIAPCNDFNPVRSDSDSDSEQTRVTADQYYKDRFEVVYDEVKEQKRRLDHQHNIVLLTQMVLNVAAVYVSDLPDVQWANDPKRFSVNSAQSVGPHLGTETMLVGQPEPVALCLASAEVGSRVISNSWLETQLDDECTQVMRYASCEDDRCVSKDGQIIFRSMLIGLHPYVSLYRAQVLSHYFTRALNADRRLSSPVRPATRSRDDCHIAACVRRINHSRPGISLLRPRSPLET